MAQPEPGPLAQVAGRILRSGRVVVRALTPRKAVASGSTGVQTLLRMSQALTPLRPSAGVSREGADVAQEETVAPTELVFETETPVKPPI